MLNSKRIWGVSIKSKRLTNIFILMYITFFTGCASTLPDLPKESINGLSGVCSSMPWRWVFHTSEYVAKGLSVIKAPSTSVGTNNCSAKWNQNKLREELISFHFPKSDWAYAKGNICAIEPTIVFLIFDKSYRPITTSKIYTKAQGYRDGDVGWQYAPYSLYRLFQENYSVNSREHKVTQFLAVVKTQCGVLPESLRVEAWTNLPGYGPNNEFTYDVVYGGTLYPRDDGLIVVHDNKELGLLYEEYSKNRIVAYAKAEQERDEKQALGALLLLLGAFGVYSSNPCNDPNITASERRWHRC